jgi:hypothetical protein
MPFGLSNAPATFQQYVDASLRPMLGLFVVAFFDDILVYTSGTIKQHMNMVEQVLDQLYAAGLEAAI